MIDTKTAKKRILSLAFRGILVDYSQKEKKNDFLDSLHKTQKNFLAISEAECLTDIPSYWNWSRLGYVTNNHGQKIPDKDFCYIDVGTLDNVHQKLAATENLIAAKDAPSRARKVVHFGDVLYSTVRPYLHNICIVDRKFSRMPIASTAFCVMHTNDSVLLNKFLFYWLLTKEFDEYSNGDSSKGTLYPAIGEKDLLLGVIPIPPLEEQSLITGKIEAAFSALDTIDTLQAKYADNLTVLKSKLIDAAIQGKLTEQLPEDGTAEELLKHLREQKKSIEDSGVLKGRKKKAILPVDDVDFPFSIPATWKWIRLDCIAEIFGRIGFRGYTKNDIVEQGKGAISLSPSNITIDGKCVYDKCTYITWEKYEESPEIMVAEEDLIIVKTGSSYGKCCVVKALPEKATINPQLALLKYILCNRYYLHIVLNSTMARKQYEDFVVGAATPTFSQEDLANFILPLPPLAEQERIVDRVNELLALCVE